MIKRLFDIILSLILVIIFSPLFLLIVVLIAAEGKELGNFWRSLPYSIFCQKRVGRFGKVFTLYKFRTMKINSPPLRAPDGSSYYSSDDWRLTRLGRFLRTFSLDELPQLLNILKGDMSFVGPRPDEVDQVRLYSFPEYRRLLCRPGLTGLAQISGRNAISHSERKRLDIEYVRLATKGGFRLDMRIIFKTIFVVLKREGIYSHENFPQQEREWVR